MQTRLNAFYLEQINFFFLDKEKKQNINFLGARTLGLKNRKGAEGQRGGGGKKTCFLSPFVNNSNQKSDHVKSPRVQLMVLYKKKKNKLINLSRYFNFEVRSTDTENY